MKSFTFFSCKQTKKRSQLVEDIFLLDGIDDVSYVSVTKDNFLVVYYPIRNVYYCTI